MSQASCILEECLAKTSLLGIGKGPPCPKPPASEKKPGSPQTSGRSLTLASRLWRFFKSQQTLRCWLFWDSEGILHFRGSFSSHLMKLRQNEWGVERHTRPVTGTPVREMTALTEQAADGNSSSSTQMELANSERVLVKKKIVKYPEANKGVSFCVSASSWGPRAVPQVLLSVCRFESGYKFSSQEKAFSSPCMVTTVKQTYFDDCFAWCTTVKSECRTPWN